MGRTKNIQHNIMTHHGKKLTLLPSLVMSSLSMASILDSSSRLRGMGRMKPGHLDAASLTELNRLRETASLPVMRMNF